MQARSSGHRISTAHGIVLHTGRPARTRPLLTGTRYRHGGPCRTGLALSCPRKAPAPRRHAAPRSDGYAYGNDARAFLRYMDPTFEIALRPGNNTVAARRSVRVRTFDPLRQDRGIPPPSGTKPTVHGIVVRNWSTWRQNNTVPLPRLALLTGTRYGHVALVAPVLPYRVPVRSRHPAPEGRNCSWERQMEIFTLHGPGIRNCASPPFLRHMALFFISAAQRPCDHAALGEARCIGYIPWHV